MTTTNTAKLLWNEQGQIGCALPGHAPYPGTDAWHSGRWQPITPNERIDFEAEVGHAPERESCAAILRREKKRS